MKKLFGIVLGLCALLLVSCGGKKADEHGLYNNIDDALEVAQKKNQSVIVAVTLDGEDYISSDFIQNVLFTDEFKNTVANNYAVVHIDFGQTTYEKTVVKDTDSKSQQKKTKKFADLMQDNTILASQLNVKVTPSFYVFSKDQYFITELHYTTLESVADFQAMLDSCQSEIEEFNSLVQVVEKGSKEEKIEAINTIYENTGAEQKIFLYELIEQLIKMDKNNECGYLGKYLVAQTEIDALVLFNEGKTLEASQKYASLCSNKDILPEQKQYLYYMAAYLLSVDGTGDPQTIIQYLKLAIDADPDNNIVEHIQTVLSSIEAMLQGQLQPEAQNE